MVPAVIWNALPDILQSWLRNWIFSIFIYFGLGFIWSYYIYQVFGSDLFPTGNVPAWSDMLEQMQVRALRQPKPPRAVRMLGRTLLVTGE